MRPVTETNVGTDDEDGKVLTFEHGIPGFARARHFMLTDLTEDGIFQLLTCIDDPNLSIVVLYPWLAFPDYEPDVPDGDLRNLGINTPEDTVVFCTVTADEDEDVLYVNLRAPFVVNARTLDARQVVLDDADLPLRASIGPEGQT